MTRRRCRDADRAIIGAGMLWRAAIASVLCAAAALAEAGQDGKPSPSSAMLNPERVTLSVPLVDGHDLQFRRVTAEGLAQTRVKQIVQDDQGFMWFGTQRGLHRYDGHELRVFRHDPRQKKSLSGVWVYSILKDRANTLWVGSDGFLDSFDARSEVFTPHGVTPEGEQSGPVNVSCMSQDSSGMLWLCTRSGLYGVDPLTQRTIALRHRPGDPSSLASDAIQFVGEDRRGALWIGTATGLDLLDRSSRRVVSHLPLSESSRGMAFHEDRFGAFWIIHGADGQLAVFDRTANALTTWKPSSIDAAADPVMFSSMLEDRDGTMWFGTLNHGVLKFDRLRHSFVRYTSDPSEPHSLSDRRVNVLYQDREGLIWAGLHQSAPNYFLPRPPSFQSIQVPGRQSTLVSAILQDRSGLVWVGLDRGMRTLDRETWIVPPCPRARRGRDHLGGGSGARCLLDRQCGPGASAVHPADGAGPHLPPRAATRWQPSERLRRTGQTGQAGSRVGGDMARPRPMGAGLRAVRHVPAGRSAHGTDISHGHLRADGGRVDWQQSGDAQARPRRADASVVSPRQGRRDVVEQRPGELDSRGRPMAPCGLGHRAVWITGTRTRRPSSTTRPRMGCLGAA